MPNQHGLSTRGPLRVPGLGRKSIAAPERVEHAAIVSLSTSIAARVRIGEGILIGAFAVVGEHVSIAGAVRPGTADVKDREGSKFKTYEQLYQAAGLACLELSRIKSLRATACRFPNGVRMDRRFVPSANHIGCLRARRWWLQPRRRG